MTKLSAHQSGRFTKLIAIGDSGTAKTGGLASLVTEPESEGGGFDLRILDFDNGLDSLKQWIAKVDPKFLDKVDYESLRDPLKMKDGKPDADAKAFVEGIKLLDKWSDGSIPSKWGEKTIFVLDTTTSMGKSALSWAEKQTPSAKDPRQWYFAAQRAFENIIALLTGDDFECNVIINAHVNRREVEDGTPTKWFPTAVGSALGALIPRYFNTMLLFESIGTGDKVRRVIKTAPTAFLDLKNPAPFRVNAEYGIEKGMAQIFKALRS